MHRAFVIGDPIFHSKSPIIHNHWIEEHGIDGLYEAIHVKQSALGDFMNTLLADKSYVGGNVTIPHKEAVFNWLNEAEARTKLTARAAHLRAVNTLYFEDDILVGDNTDGFGFIANLDEYAPLWRQTLNSIVVIGAGGAARAVIYALYQLQNDLNAEGTFFIANRTLERAESLKQDLELDRARIITLSELPKIARDTDFLVNTTSLGMKDEATELPLTTDDISSETHVSDIVYTPLMTSFLQLAQQSGAKTIDGLGMLLHQAVPGFEKWFGIRPMVSKELRQKILDSMGQ